MVEQSKDLDRLVNGNCNPGSLYEDEMVSVHDVFHKNIRTGWLNNQVEKASKLISQKEEVEDVLEIGCGTCLLGSELTDRFDFDYTGLEPNKDMISTAEERMDKRYNLIRSDFKDFDSDKKYDFIIMLGRRLNHYHFEWFEDFFTNLSDFLSKNGEIIYDFIPQKNWDEDRMSNIIQGEVEGYKIIRADFSKRPEGRLDRRSHYSAYETYKIINSDSETELSFKYDIYPHLISKHSGMLDENHMDYEIDTYLDGTSFVRVY